MGAEVATLCLHEAADIGELRQTVREWPPLLAVMTRERAEMILALEAATARQCADMSALHGALGAVRAGQAHRADSLLAFERANAQLAAVQRDLRSEVLALRETQEQQAGELKHLASELERRTATMRAKEREHAASGEQRLTAMAARVAGAAERMRNEVVALLRAELAKQADAVRAHLDEAESRMAAVANDNAVLRSQVGDQATANAQLRDEMAKLRAEAAKRADAMRARLDEAEQRAAQLVADNTALRNEVAKLRSEAAEFRRAVAGRLSGLGAGAEALRRAVSAMQLFDCEGLALRAWAPTCRVHGPFPQ